MKKPISHLDLSTLMTSMMAGSLALTVSLAFAQHADSAAMEKDHLYHQHYEEFAKVPEKARAKSNPLAEDPDAPVAGKKLFEQHCAECHGNTAEGGRKAPSLRTEEVQQATPGTLFWILTNGVVRRGMPVWSKLPEPQRWQIVTYVKSLGPREMSHDDGEAALRKSFSANPEHAGMASHPPMMWCSTDVPPPPTQRHFNRCRILTPAPSFCSIRLPA